MVRSILLVGALVAALASSGCADATDREKSAGTGAALGAGAGAVMGAIAGNTLMRAALGAGAGLLGCGGENDGGLARCQEWLAVWNGLPCVTTPLAEADYCDPVDFARTVDAGCSWDVFYDTCIATTECDANNAPVEACGAQCQ